MLLNKTTLLYTKEECFMKLYYNQNKISSSLKNFFSKIFSLSKPLLNNLSFVISGIISAESAVTSDISKKLKDHFSSIHQDSSEKHIRRFFKSFSSLAYSFYDAFIHYIISKFCVKHSDNKVHISLDHMFCRNKYTILLFSLRIGKQGIPLWFRCFKGKHNSNAYSINLINEGISYCSNLFSNRNYHIIFLADRWFPHIEILSHIQSINCFYCFRCKSFFTYSYYNSKGKFVTSHLRDIKPLKYSGKVINNALFTRNLFKTTIVVSNSSNTDDPWYLITNDDPSRAIRNYSYRFGSIETIFKSQKSGGFRLESTKIQKVEHFISLYTIICIALTWLTIIGADYVKNKHHYHIKIRDTKKSKNNASSRIYSLFNLGLTIFNRCYYNYVDFTLKFNFILYDV